jgi:DNA-binding NarL/FixJ family response regulator
LAEAIVMIADLAEIEAPTRVLIVDDAASTRHFLRGVLDFCPQFEVAGEADNGASAIEVAEAIQPDVVLLDLSMPVSDGASALSGLLSVAPNARVIVLSGTDKKGAVVPKGLAPFELLDRLGSILKQPVTMQRTAPGRESPADVEAVRSQTNVRAVICDDDAGARHLVAQILDICDMEVLAETDAVPHLLSVVEHSKPELVVLDLWLEGTSGTSAIPDIRRLSPRTQVVVYSAFEEWKDKAFAAGASAFVAKPNLRELETEIRWRMPTPTK